MNNLHSICKGVSGFSKRVFFFVLFSFIIQQSFASTYYISSVSGNDDYSYQTARHPQTPWKTLAKLNSVAGILTAGDSVLLKRGEIFSNPIVISRSGSPFAPIYFGAYGLGSKPIINAMDKLTNWTAIGNGIYETSCTTGGTTLTLNNVQQAMGRYPNSGYLTYRSHNANNSITDSKLNNAIDWTGADVVIRKNRWVIDVSTITSQAGGTITYTAGTKDIPTNGFGYFIQNSLKTLDQFGEWYFDAAAKKMYVYFGNKNPKLYDVETGAVNVIVDITKHNYITFDNIAFVGASQNAFKINNSSNITVKNCDINVTGGDAIIASYSPFISVKNSTINHSLNDALNFDIGCVYASVTNNEISNTGMIAGMGKNGTGTYEAITAFGDNTMIEKNHIDSTGYDGIYFGGNSSTTKNNFVDHFCYVKDDGPGIYIADWTKTINKKVLGNIVLHGVGAGEGSSYPASKMAEGIYIDDNTESLTVSGNTISLCANNGIKIHNAKDIKICNNTVFDNGVQLRLEQDHYIATSSYIRNNSITNNILVSKSTNQPNVRCSTQLDDINSFGKIDSNFYSRPDDQAQIKTLVVRNGKEVNNTYSLNDWKTTYHKDNGSTKTLKKLTTKADGSYILFEYNASNLVKIINLSKPYMDAHNHIYKNTITISPYSSVVLTACNIAERKQAPILAMK